MMERDEFTFIVGGKAGEGVKKTGFTAGRLFAGLGRYTFEMEDYMSVIRGGHSFSAVSTATRPITSHYMKADLVVAFDKRSCDAHRDHVAPGGTMVYNSDAMEAAEGVGLPLTSEAKKYPNPSLRLGVGAIAVLAAALGLDQDSLSRLIQKEYPRDTENNLAYATTIYGIAFPKIGGKCRLVRGDKERPIVSGNEAIAIGAAAAGLDIYASYPMTPSSPILHFLARQGESLGVSAIHPDSEIAAVNIAIGATFAGARAMVGTSGGGFGLMEEAFSLAGMLEAPLLCVLGSRPGPSTGVATYTEQGDLGFAIHAGHGEFPGIVASPGSIEEAYRLSAEMLGLVWRFQTPGILLTEKHLGESSMTVDIDIDGAESAEPLMHADREYKRYLDTPNGVSPLLFPPTTEMNKWNSHEHDEAGITTEEAHLVTQMHDKRQRKGVALVERLKDLKTVNEFGESGPVIFTYGSTTMSVLEALRAGKIDATVVQPIYLEPFPTWELEKYRNTDAVVVEQSCAGQFANLVHEKSQIAPKAVIRRYDGRPFDPEELAQKIKEVA